jgi:hypothetical protein
MPTTIKPIGVPFAGIVTPTVTVVRFAIEYVRFSMIARAFVIRTPVRSE